MVPDGVVVQSFTMITHEPGVLFKNIHNRQPVIMRPENYAAWLDPGLNEISDILYLLRPYPDNLISGHPVGRAVRRAGSTSEETMRPLDGFDWGYLDNGWKPLWETGLLFQEAL